MKGILGTILCIFIIFSALNVSFATQIGSTSYGYVTKEYYGNLDSNDTIIIIIGVHPKEYGIHKAIKNALISQSDSLNKKYVLYQVNVTKDASDYSKGRMNGQLLAQKFIVPDVSNENPMLVMDMHENRYKVSSYKYPRFLYPISNNSLTNTFVNEILSKMPFLVSYIPPNGTSPQYVTVPIANKGINTIIYETFINDSETEKSADANSLLNVLDSDAVNKLVVKANPTSGNYNSPKNITLSAPTGTTIYYTTDGTDPTNNSLKYSRPVQINNTTTLKFICIDNKGKKSAIVTEKYIINKTKPAVVLTTPKNGSKGFSRTAIITIKFSTNIKSSSTWSQIYIKNLKTGKKPVITKTISGNTLKIKMTLRRMSYNNYKVYIPSSAIKDSNGNNMVKYYSFNFKTGKY
ncbi:chitobiase/beta-hexosaminidase C-terminal domain-containing protein [Methanobacterium alcaliphilum]|uniref:chitobiase/beta-hexosaminidase C-terminal domain-containing protein n=1 Tax=Methanobacterium alcaliphilum TaxID=392018 RepID=UPI00200B93C3|nr:chitobiase/beta-hexosaminidase C-terminal domain-containing protein [Methanobacterium alcaliphilum]MCK9152586.1 chitobiase/beta-hexosaminidase C-terminal domain-containing protein [Methanobacterium alcaliphilum]